MNNDMSGYTSPGPSWKERQEEQQLRQRIADLEQALCGLRELEQVLRSLCQQLTEMGDPYFKHNLRPQVQAWLDKQHKQRLGGDHG